MPFISQIAIGVREQLQVFGGDYDTVDGTGVRDYLHVCDLADGHVAALDYLDQCNGVEAFNLGTGRLRSSNWSVHLRRPLARKFHIK